ncbi:hypothetical protein BDY24DRAFT_255965 [Mrakia frigida]|uniref:nucleotidyltransferase domain-containing protein n=1 Tax=Mrakia frigida TaxID=29902 RepID=UPI003FCC0D8A
MTSPTQTSSTSTPPPPPSNSTKAPPKEPGASKGGKGSSGHGSRGGGSSSRGGRGKKRGGGESSTSTRPPPSSSSTTNAKAGPSSHSAPPKPSGGGNGGGGGGPPRALHPPNGSSSSNFPPPRGLRPNRGRINIMFRNPRTPASFGTDPDLRATLPKELSKGGGPLHKELMKSWKASLPTPATAAARKQLIDAISHVVASYGPQFRIALFGSAAIGGDRDQSDMDLCVVDLNSPEGYQIPNGALKADDQIYNPRNLANRLERAGLVGVQAIPWARTPIVKCSDPTSGIEVDIKLVAELSVSFLVLSMLIAFSLLLSAATTSEECTTPLSSCPTVSSLPIRSDLSSIPSRPGPKLGNSTTHPDLMDQQPSPPTLSTSSASPTSSPALIPPRSTSLLA